MAALRTGLVRRLSAPRGASFPSRLSTVTGMGVGAGFAALLVGRVGHWNIPGTPLPIGLTLGVGLHLLDAFGITPTWMGPHLADAGNGAIVSWITMLGASWGRQMAAGNGVAAAAEPITAGVVGGASGRASNRNGSLSQLPPAQHRLTEAELTAYLRDPSRYAHAA